MKAVPRRSHTMTTRYYLGRVTPAQLADAVLTAAAAALADRDLDRVRYQRLPLWRYSLIWARP